MALRFLRDSVACRSLRCSGFALTLILVFGTAGAAPGQARAAGRVVRVMRGDTIPVSGADVVLHRVGRQEQGPVDSMPSDRKGRFSFRFQPDTSAIYLVSARFAGIEYFSPPVHTNPARPDTGLVLGVSDTSSSAAVDLETRHLVISGPAKDGTRGVLDILVLRNRGDRTRVAPDSLTPTFAVRLPAGMLGLQVGQGDISPDAVTLGRDSALVFAPISPGEKQVVLTYTIPADRRRLEIPIDQPVETINLLLEEASAKATGAGVVKADSQTIEGHKFRRWSGSATDRAVVVVGFAGAGVASWALPGLVGLVAVALILAGLFFGVRGLRVSGQATALSPRDGLVEAIARLDARYLGQESQTPAEEWRRYQVERARLKAELSAHLAVGGSGA